MTDASSYIGKRIGNYRVVTELSNSLFSRVFRGEHLYLSQRIVAIKLLNAYLDSSQERDRFLQEAELLAMLKHRHILPILDVGVYDHLPYLVVEYAHQGSLRDRLKRHPSPHPFPLEEALTILRQVGQALQYAHEHNVVHRDLKPENILFNAGGEALLADFNIATVLERAQTTSVDALGSPPYMAPEQFEGMISKRSDLYALGCIAYELVTGRPPFRAPNAFTFGLKHKHEPPYPPCQLNPQLPTHIEQAILKAMAKERADRHRTVSAFIMALRLLPMQQAKEPSTTESSLSRDLKRCEETVASYEHALLNPGSAIFHTKRGNLLYERKRDEEALSAYEQALQLDPHLAEVHNGKGNVLYYFNRHGEALVAYERATQLDPHFAEAYDGKGWVLWHLGRHEEALNASQRAIELNPSYASAYHGKGNVLFELGRFEEAATAYEHAIRLDPTLTYAHLGKGDALFHLGRYEEALSAYEQAIRLDPKLASAHDGKANALGGLKRYEEALSAYDQAIVLDPSAVLYYQDKGKLLQALGRIQEAEQVYEQMRHLSTGG